MSGAIVRCQCGEITGVQCDGVATVLVNWMPEYLRETHRKARNSGVWPHNGAVRLALTRECAENLAQETEEVQS